MTVYTPSNVIVQGAISLAKHVGIEGSAWIEQVNIPGYGEVELGPNTSTVRWELNSITFAAPYRIGTILVAVYSE